VDDWNARIIRSAEAAETDLLIRPTELANLIKKYNIEKTEPEMRQLEADYRVIQGAIEDSENEHFDSPLLKNF
jgi:hypothetical protein